MVIFDPIKDKAIQFSSEAAFSFAQAYQTVRKIRKGKEPENLEVYTCEDYKTFELADFRTLRRNNKPIASANPELDPDDSDLDFPEDDFSPSSTDQRRRS